jgi:N-acetyl-anhydromuramoyl-L-alanine amidase
MNIDIETGWIREARKVPSPNCDARPVGTDLGLIVVHGISLPPKEFGVGWIDDLFINQLDRSAHQYFETIAELTVSAHVLVARDGRLTQYVSFDQRAWHAGESSWCGRAACNDFAVGIEVVGADDVPYAAQQYDSLVQVIKALRRAYPTLRGADVVGHCDVSPGRKTDPGPAFDWHRLHSLL